MVRQCAVTARCLHKMVPRFSLSQFATDRGWQTAGYEVPDHTPGCGLRRGSVSQMKESIGCAYKQGYRAKQAGKRVEGRGEQERTTKECCTCSLARIKSSPRIVSLGLSRLTTGWLVAVRSNKNGENSEKRQRTGQNRAGLSTQDERSPELMV